MMQHDSTLNPLLSPLRRAISRSQWQNLILLVLAVQFARTLIQRRLALFLICAISSASCYRRLARMLSWKGVVWDRLAYAWVRAVLATFAPGNGCLILLIDWTMHRDRCRSLWIMLPLGGRAVPLAFFLAPNEMGGKGAQRQFEDQALTQLRRWLPGSRRAILIGDRGFRGADRMRLLKRMGFRFVLRITGDTFLQTKDGWGALRDVAPSVGEQRRWGHVLLGKTVKGGPLRVNVVAVRQALLEPKRVLTNKGKATGKVAEETTWFLATDLPLRYDIVALYRLRMQVEESFKDKKSLFGMEEEYTKQPWERLRGLMWGLTIGMAVDLWHGKATPTAPTHLPPLEGKGDEAPSPEVPRYRAESQTREGLHDLIVQVVLGRSPLTQALHVIAAKSARMQARPQVRERRLPTPALRNRTKAHTKQHVHA
jgi:DDE family transposase